MPAFKITNFKDISFKMDCGLNVLEANRNFSGLFDVTDPKINLGQFMDNITRENFRFFLDNLVNGEPYASRQFFATLSSPLTSIDFIFEVMPTGTPAFDVILHQLDFSRTVFETSIRQNIELKSLIKNLDRYYFVYSRNKFHLKHSKEQNEIFSGNADEFKEYLVKSFNINTGDSVTNLQFTAMLFDVQKFKTKKSYNFIMTNGKMISIHPEFVKDEERQLIIATIISEDKTGLTENLYSQNKDGLTDMLNKKAITEQVTHRVDVLKEPGSLIILDIDKFKDYNDTFGHAYGDKVIVAVANVIKETINDIGIAGRIGGDEFMIFIKSTDEQDIRNVTRNIRTGISWAITSADPSCVVTCSMGIASFPTNVSTYDDLFKLADKCLYIAKNKGRNCYVIYKPEIHDNVIIKNEREAVIKASGQLYSDDADAQMEILQLLQSEEGIQPVIDKLRDYMKITQITIYNSDLEPEYVSGLNPDFRKPYFNEDYFKYFNSYNFLHLDNTVTLDVVDKEKHAMYRDASVASTIEYVKRNEDGTVHSLMCFDVYKPARTFAKEKVVFALMMAKFLTNLL